MVFCGVCCDRMLWEEFVGFGWAGRGEQVGNLRIYSCLIYTVNAARAAPRFAGGPSGGYGPRIWFWSRALVKTSSIKNSTLPARQAPGRDTCRVDRLCRKTRNSQNINLLGTNRLNKTKRDSPQTPP